MSFNDWLQNSIDRYKSEPIHKATNRSVEQFAAGLRRRAGYEPDPDVGDFNVYDRDWDVLIVLDACRPDVLRVVGKRYPWLRTDELECYQSVASYSKEWLEQTFTHEYHDKIRDTALVSWNPYTDAAHDFDENQLGTIRQPYYDEWDNSMGLVRPDTITDVAIDVLGTEERTIAWYMQPHAPYRTLINRIETFTAEQIGDESAARTTVWNLLRAGDLDPIEAYAGYVDNLIWVLDDVERLLVHVDHDADVIVTADHGELFGEDGYWGHPKNNYHDQQLAVPWVPVDQSRVAEEPIWGSQERTGEDSVAEQLQALGYR
ncbi:MAG: sulfatase-like hydrolase/transferase [Halobacteriaceae archaeon]